MQRLINCLVISILLICESSSDPRIDMMEFKEKQCTTKCENEMIITTDTCDFKCLVYLEGFPKNSYATFLLRRKSDRFAKEIFSLEPFSDCKRFVNKTPHACTSINDTVFSISVLVNASIEYKEAEITCKLQIPGTNVIKRKVQNFPKVFDSRDSTWILKINGNYMSSENCSTSINSMNLTLEFSCLSNASPCLIRIILNESTRPVEGKDSVLFNAILKEEAMISITFAACKLEKFYNNIICKIRPELIKMSELHTSYYNLIVILLPTVCGAMLILIVICIIICIRKNIHEKQKEKSREKQTNSLALSLLKSPENNIGQITYEIKDGTDANSQTKCCKTDHTRLTDFNKFNIKDIPTELYDEQLDDLIKVMGALTVKLTVKNAGNKSNDIKSGTGWVEGVIKHGRKENKECICNKCRKRKSKSKVWRELFVYTSTHVVFNEDEANQTTCRFFYNCDEKEPSELSGFMGEKCYINCESFLIKYVTCNKDDFHILSKINKSFKRWKYIHTTISERNRDEKHTKKTVCIVSHVHGGPKKVSLGVWEDRTLYEENNKDEIAEVTKYTYTAQTCLGSTGAYVCIVGRDHRMWASHHLHCGVDTQGKNFSTYAIDWC